MRIRLLFYRVKIAKYKTYSNMSDTMEITKSPDPILKKRLRPVSAIDDSVREIISKMRQTMLEANGVGLAANQIGLDLQIFVISKELADESNAPDAYINPVLVNTSPEQDEMEEGCLSLPDYWTSVKRSKKVHIRALDEDGNKIKLRARGFLARVFQHEYDHLCGIMIKDRE